MRKFILFIYLLSPAYTIFAQSLSLTLECVDLKTFVRAVEAQSAYRFIYGEDVKPDHPITVRVDHVSVQELLDKAFSNQPIEAKIEHNHILLIQKLKKTQHYTISGYVTDAHSKEVLIGANVLETGKGKGTATNEYGFYSITLPEGEITLQCSYVTYQPVVSTFVLNKNIELHIELSRHVQLNEVIVTANAQGTGIHATNMGALDIPLDQIRNTPALLGEADIMKTIQLMPGVQAGTEGTSGIYVRGGGPDENLILLDGVPLYNVDHLFGFFSVFTPESVKKVSLYKGSFPSRFGGRLSSVIDVRTNDGHMQKYHGMTGIGLLSARFQAEGPFIKDKTSFNISGRRSYIDLLVRPFMDDDDDKISYYFYDFNAKINHKINDRHRLYLSLYKGQDQLGTDYKESWSNYRSADQSVLAWGNFMAALKWNAVLSAKLFSNTTVAYTVYDLKTRAEGDEISGTDIDKNKEFYSYVSRYNSGIKDSKYSTDFDYHPNPSYHLKFGANYLYHCFKPEVQTARIKEASVSISNDTIYRSASNSKVYAHEAAVYAENEFDAFPGLRINLGGYASAFHVERKTYFSLQPRISMRYQLTGALFLKTAYTQMNQYIHLLSSYTITLPTDLWVPTTRRIKPMKSRQYSLGTYYTGVKGWEFSVEGYYKQMRNILEYEDGASFVGSSHNWEEKVEMGRGRAMGVEFMAQKTIGRATGWIGYTLSKSDRQFSADGINNGERFPYKYDRRHRVSLSANYALTGKIDLGISWEFTTGGTTTLPLQRTLVIRPEESHPGWFGNATADLVEKRNNYRLPVSHHLNVGINFKRKRAVWNVSIYNIYNAMNPAILYKSNKYDDDAGREKTIVKKVTILPFIPSLSYTYKF